MVVAAEEEPRGSRRSDLPQSLLVRVSFQAQPTTIHRVTLEGPSRRKGKETNEITET
ncbi:hypothetical protein ACSRUE_17650 [Sorangium sp. KYC3313]|uniref:hypothetical protein n=1 Tax=Sorangium sp. KYC3313 TaxID=3449740 RepID=UPI003F8C733A